MGIKQLNGSYLDHEDRILFRFNTDDAQEYRLWFTRRITLFILASTNLFVAEEIKKSNSSPTSKVIADFHQTTLEDQIAKPAEPGQLETYQGGSHYPLGTDTLIVMDIQCQMIQQGGENAVSLNFLLPGGGNLNLTLNSQFLLALYMMLNQLVSIANWQSLSEVKIDQQEKDRTEFFESKISIH
jgi:hypothetical protein